MFYKNNNGTLLEAADNVHAPAFSLMAIQHATYKFPVDGWTWYNDLATAQAAEGIVDDAVVFSQTAEEIEGLKALQRMPPLTRAQLRLALLETNLLDIVEAAVASADTATQISYRDRPLFERTHAMVAAITLITGKTEAEVDAVWAIGLTK